MNPPSWLDHDAYPFFRRPFQVSDGTLNAVDEGTGPAVVLVHGTPTWSFEWRHVIAGLRDSHRVIAPDHLGFGLSDRPLTAGYRPEDHARRFAELMDQALPQGEKTVLVVHDFGGPIALDWALRHPGRIRQIVVVNSWMWSLADDPKMKQQAALVGGRIGRWLYRRLNASLRLLMPSAYGNRKRLTRSIHRQYLAPFPDAGSRELVLFALAQSLLGSTGYYENLWERRETLHALPLTVLWGVKDSAFPPKVLQRWQDTFPHARVHTFAGAGHWPHEEEPEAFVAALRGALTA